MPAIHKFIVGVDFGTTYTGVSYVETSRNSLRDIWIIQDWPGPSRAAEVTCKTPSRIAYPSENEGICNSIAFGYSVTPRMKSYSWFKLLLDRSSATRFDDPSLSSTEGPGVLRLPPGKRAQEVCADYLREIFRTIIAKLEQRYTAEIIRVTSIEFWFTVPAIWSDSAKNDTLSAARVAGFGSRPGDQVNLISEPEAAAIATLKGLTTDGTENQIAPGDGVLICDCGGGTVDITTYSIRSVRPELDFEELLRGEGGKCGSTYIDRQFHVWMTNKFGEAFRTIPFANKGPGSRFMREFECCKLDFGSNNDTEHEFPLVMPGVEESEYYDAAQGLVRMRGEDMEGLFRPVVQRVLELLGQQLQRARVETGKQINKILLVGGFGDSRYLLETVRQWSVGQGGPRVLCPDRPQAAVVLGAALRGLVGLKPKSRRSRCHYGFQLDLQYDPNLDDERHMYVSKFDRSKRTRGTMVWPLRMDSVVNEDTFISQGVVKPWLRGETLLFNITLYSSSAELPPRREEHPRVQRVGTISVDLRNTNMNKFKRRWSIRQDRWIWELKYELQILFGSREGVLCFRAKTKDDIVGTTQIEYSHD